jgi:hypothetical protein
VQLGGGREQPVEQSREELVLPLEVEEDQAVAELRLGGDGADRDAVDPFVRCDLVGSGEDLLAAGALGRFLAGHGVAPVDRLYNAY